MSRSIHTTRRTLDDQAKRILKKGASLKDVESALRKSGEQLRKKRLIKRQVLEERRSTPLPVAESPISTIPIEVGDAGEFVHHAASPEDIHHVLEALPPATIQGLARIQMDLGKEYMDERSDNDEARRDPFTNRVSCEIFPGVFGGRILGTYYPQGGRVFIYAYVYDPSHLPLPRSLCEVYLKLHALQTLVHEVAHHHDTTCRVGRGRWLADRPANVESYAEKMEYQWAREVVIPYLKRACPKETRDLRKWVSHRGGILLPLEFFAGDNRHTRRDGLERLFFSTSGGFESWVGELPKCKTLDEGRLAFAWELHYSDEYQHCLAVLDQILSREPSCVEALTCKADTLVHLERLDEAFSVAEAAIRLDGQNPDAWETRGDVFEWRDDWKGLLDNCARWEEAGKPTKTAQREIHLHRAIANCALGNEPEMETSLKAHLATFRFRSEDVRKRRTVFARRGVFRRAGKPVPPELNAKCTL